METYTSINAVDNPVEYLNGSVWAKLAPSSLGGVGVFAIRDIPKGVPITDNSRNDMIKPFVYQMKEHDFKKLIKPIRDLILDKTILPNLVMFQFISPNSECFLQDFCNHSDNPNVSSDGFIALRDIKEGEEILEDYTKFLVQGGGAHALTKNHYKPYATLN